MESWEKEKDLDKNKGTEIPRWGWSHISRGLQHRLTSPEERMHQRLLPRIDTRRAKIGVKKGKKKTSSKMNDKGRGIQKRTEPQRKEKEGMRSQIMTQRI